MAHKNRNLPDTWRWGIHLIIGVLFMVGIVFSRVGGHCAQQRNVSARLLILSNRSPPALKSTMIPLLQSAPPRSGSGASAGTGPCARFFRSAVPEKQTETLWLTGISVLAPDGTLLCESTTNGIGYARFGEQLKNDTVLDVFSYLQKTYLKRVLLEDGSAVDVAAYRQKTKM